MAVNGPILLIENDPEEQKKVKQVLVEIRVKNPLEMFGNAEQALAYLETTEDKPFIILSNMSLTGISGL